MHCPRNGSKTKSDCTIGSRFPSRDTVCLHWKYCKKIICQGLRLLQKSSLLCSVLCILHYSKGSVWDLPQRWDPTPQETKPVLVYPERRILSSGPSPHRSNFTNLGLLLTIPDEWVTIFGHEVPFFLHHTNSEQHRGNCHKDRHYFTPAGTYLIIEI